jgi:hypothetical protein
MKKLPFTTRRAISHIVWGRTRDSERAAKRLEKLAGLPPDKKIKKGLGWSGWLKPMASKTKEAHLYFICLLKAKNRGGRWEVCAWAEPAIEGDKIRDIKKLLIKKIKQILKTKSWEHESVNRGELIDPYWFAATKGIGWKYYPINSWLLLLILSFLPIKIYRRLKFVEWLPLGDKDLKKL